MERVGIDRDMPAAAIDDPLANLFVGRVAQSQAERGRLRIPGRLVVVFLTEAAARREQDEQRESGDDQRAGLDRCPHEVTSE